MKINLVPVLKLVIICLFVAVTFRSAAVAGEKEKSYPSIPGEYVVKLKEAPNAKTLNTFEAVAQLLQKKLGLKSVPQVTHFKTNDQFAVISVQGIKSVQALLATDDRVQYAEPNYIFHAYDLKQFKNVPNNDEKMGQLWGMQNTGQTDTAGQVGKAGSDINIVPVWNEGITGSKKIKVAIIDTGVDYNHPDLKSNIMVNESEIPGDGIDNDKNGFIDDVYGWDFANDRANGLDDHNHGTHCAGTIGGSGNNSIGVAGVNWNVSMLPIKFLSSDGSGSLSGAVQSIQYAIKMNVNIMSNSWGGGAFTQALFESITEAKKKGILFVAAAGNDSNDNDANASYPATYQIDNVVSVAATDNKDQIAGFSNYGRTKVHVAAPGVKILSTLKGGEYGVFSGTSMATPHVAGIAALLLSANPSLSYAQIKDSLIKTSARVRSLSRKVVARGRVDVYNAVHGIEPKDEAPSENAWKDYGYSAETPHPYESSKTYQFDINVKDAKFIRVIFDSFESEASYDKLSIKDVKGDEIETMSGSYAAGYASDYIVGDKGTLTFKSDTSVNKAGFKVSKIQVVY